MYSQGLKLFHVITHCFSNEYYPPYFSRKSERNHFITQFYGLGFWSHSRPATNLYEFVFFSVAEHNEKYLKECSDPNK